MSRLGLLIAVLAVGLGPPAASADAHEDASSPPMAGSHYVIKVTPTLVYLDAGSEVGAHPAQSFVVVREHEGMFVPVGHVTLIRVYDSFSIAEVNHVAADEDIAVLDRAVTTDEWKRMAPEMATADDAPAAEERRLRRVAITILGGADLGKDVDLRFQGPRLTGTDAASGGGVGLRLSRVAGRYWRFGLSYRLSGEPLGGDADVTQLSAELDVHLLLRGAGRAGPYVGVGAGLHQLSWDSPANVDDSTFKAGYQVVGGIEVPRGGGAWSLLLEGGYQKVAAWDDLLDASHVRLYAGLARNF